jgi:hypothetical protein
MTVITKKQIELDGKTYGYVFFDGILQPGIRSESNPTGKTPYLKEGSKQYAEVMAAIHAKEGK